MQDSAENKSSNLALAAIGRKHFGNPIPQEWYAAARELLAQQTKPDPERVTQAVATALYGEPPPPGSNSLTRAMQIHTIRDAVAETLT